MTDYDFGPKNAEEKVFFDKEEARVDQEIAEYERSIKGKLHKLVSKVHPTVFYEIQWLVKGMPQINGLEINDWLRIYAVRPVRYFFQRLSRGGWDDSDTWSLDDHLAKLILPRLKRFKELNVHGWPGEQPDGSGPKTWEEWQSMLDSMIFAFEWDCDEDRKYYSDYSEETYKKVEEGHLLFGKWFNALWD